MRSRHESSRLFMPRYDQLDSGMAETLDHIEILFCGQTQKFGLHPHSQEGYE
jgi:hypothetical protein